MEDIIQYKSQRVYFLDAVFKRQLEHDETLAESTREVLSHPNPLDKVSLEGVLGGTEYEDNFSPVDAVSDGQSPQEAVDSIREHAIIADVKNGWENFPVGLAQTLHQVIPELEEQYGSVDEFRDAIYYPDSALVELDGEERFVLTDVDITETTPDVLSGREVLSPFVNSLSVTSFYWWITQEHPTLID